MRETPSALAAALTLFAAAGIAAAPHPIPLWPGTPPGDTAQLPPEADTTVPGDQLIAGRPVIRLGNVSTPTITVYAPDPAKNTGAAVVVCPGGGYHILALDLEGTEVCDWLNSLGVTGVLLKYRVPARDGGPSYLAALEDAQRALGLVRQNATAWGIDPKRVGVLGFSAGGNLAAVLSNNFEQRAYPPVDAADEYGCRPDFAFLIYPGSLVDENNAVAPQLTVRAGKTPPTFLVQAANDPIPVQNSVYYFLALRRAGVPAELHVYATGGHGYGLRRTDEPVTSWPDRAADWLKASGWLQPLAPDGK